MNKLRRLDPEVRLALIAIQKDLLVNVSIHQHLVAELQKCSNEVYRKVFIQGIQSAENKIKELDHKQKKFLADVRRSNVDVTTTKEERPISIKKERPISIKEEKPISIKEEKSISIKEEKPISIKEEKPISITEDEPPPKKEEKPATPQKLIEYQTKRPSDEDLSSVPLKKKKIDKRARLFAISDQTKEKPSEVKSNCFSPEEEERLRAYGCFYVFSKQEKLTRPLTEQDYFLMNFGLVSRDHIQYAPYDVSLNVRRTRRQLHSKPKYKSSEWETTLPSSKKLKLLKGKTKGDNLNNSFESPPASPKQKGVIGDSSSLKGRIMMNKEPNAEAALAIRKDKEAFSNLYDEKVTLPKQLHNQVVMVKEKIRDFSRTDNHRGSLVETDTILLQNELLQNQLRNKLNFSRSISSMDTAQSHSLSHSRISSLVNITASKPASHEQLDSLQSHTFRIESAPASSISALPIKEQSSAKFRYLPFQKIGMSPVIEEGNDVEQISSQISTSTTVESGFSSKPLSHLSERNEMLQTKPDIETNTPEDAGTRQEQKIYPKDDPASKTIGSNSLKFLPTDTDSSQRCSVEPSNLIPVSKGIPLQNIGISIRSDLSETDILLNSCSNIDFASLSSRREIIHDDPSDKSELLEPERLVSNHMMREQVNIV
nr:PREDICTED: uncharacterized protein LOC109034059 isoform X1 [Bemisia tabaci]